MTFNKFLLVTLSRNSHLPQWYVALFWKMCCKSNYNTLFLFTVVPVAFVLAMEKRWSPGQLPPHTTWLVKQRPERSQRAYSCVNTCQESCSPALGQCNQQTAIGEFSSHRINFMMLSLRWRWWWRWWWWWWWWWRWWWWWWWDGGGAFPARDSVDAILFIQKLQWKRDYFSFVSKGHFSCFGKVPFSPPSIFWR